jgi:hypothetical protein
MTCHWTALHDAWELGQRNDQETGNFLAHYLKKVSGGENDPFTAEIEIVTPYAEVVDQSRQKTTSYSEEQAARDYRQRGNTILIKLVIMLPATYLRQEQTLAQQTHLQRTTVRCVQKISGRTSSSI